MSLFKFHKKKSKEGGYTDEENQKLETNALLNLITHRTCHLSGL